MIGQKPLNLPKRLYAPYHGETADQLGALLKRRNPFAQSSVSALKEGKLCRLKIFFSSVIGLTTPQHPKAKLGEELHDEIEVWAKGGAYPTHPSILYAITEGLLDLPDATVESEVEFWHATGIKAPTSPDKQLWLRGYIDRVQPNRITDFKSKDNPEYCVKYSLTPEGLLKDEQVAVYSHVIGDGRKVAQLTFSRDRHQPYAYPVEVALSASAARATYLKLLDAANTAIEDSQCGDWKAIPGNFAKCEKPFRCAFIPICHGAQPDMFDMGMAEPVVEKEPLMPNPLVNMPVAITPPDAAPAGPWTEPAKTKKESVVTEGDDFDAVLNAAMGVTTAKAAPTPPKPPPPPPPAAKPDEGSTDASALDALLNGGAVKAKPPSAPPAPAQAITVSKPAPPPPSTPPAPPVQQSLPTTHVQSTQAAVAPVPAPAPTPGTRPIAVLYVGCAPSTGGYVLLSEIIAQTGARIVEEHNKRGGATKIHSVYQIDHGGWRGDLAAVLPHMLPTMRPLRIVAIGRTPAMDAAVEVLTHLSVEHVWPTG